MQTTSLQTTTWLDAGERVSITELATVCSLSTAELRELMEYGALTPLSGGHAEPTFSAACVMRLRQAGRLRRDFELDLHAVSLLLGYLERIEALEGELSSLRAQSGGAGA